MPGDLESVLSIKRKTKIRDLNDPDLMADSLQAVYVSRGEATCLHRNEFLIPRAVLLSREHPPLIKLKESLDAGGCLPLLC